MKKSYLALALVFAFAGSSLAGPEWQTDLKKAQEEAKANKKLVFVNFTGSDWCEFCILMDRDVFSKPQFKDFASKNLVLLEIDYPRGKEQPLSLRKQNQELGAEYQVMGFPTIMLLGNDGKMLWRSEGYFEDGVDALVAELQKLRKS